MNSKRMAGIAFWTGYAHAKLTQGLRYEEIEELFAEECPEIHRTVFGEEIFDELLEARRLLRNVFKLWHAGIANITLADVIQHLETFDGGEK